MSTLTITPLRQRMIEDMSARKLGRHSQRSHIYSWTPPNTSSNQRHRDSICGDSWFGGEDGAAAWIF
jgi:hypothetical protein